MTDNHIRSAEAIAVINAIGAVVTAAVLSQIEMLRFGTFAQMLGAMLTADAVVYAAMKLGWLKQRNNGNRT